MACSTSTSTRSMLLTLSYVGSSLWKTTAISGLSTRLLSRPRLSALCCVRNNLLDRSTTANNSSNHSGHRFALQRLHTCNRTSWCNSAFGLLSESSRYILSDRYGTFHRQRPHPSCASFLSTRHLPNGQVLDNARPSDTHSSKHW